MRRGFTLIELLVVIAVIAVLISILLPALSEVRQTAWQAQESSNQRQLLVAGDLYSEEFDGYFHPIQDEGKFLPPGRPRGFEVTAEGTWRVYLWEFIDRNSQAYDSPAERDARYQDGLSWFDLQQAQRAGALRGVREPDPNAHGRLGPLEMYNQSGIGANLAHYWYSKSQGWDAEGRGPFGRPVDSGYSEGLARRADAQFPGKLILYTSGGTAHQAFPEDTWWTYKFDGPVRGPGFDRFQQHLRHGSDPGALRYGGRGVYAFADGHAETLDPRRIQCTVDACWWSLELDTHD